MINLVFIFIFLIIVCIDADDYPNTCIISGEYGIIRFDHSGSTSALASAQQWWFKALDSDNFAINSATNGEYFMFGSSTTMDIWKVKNDRSSGDSTDDDGWKGGLNNNNKLVGTGNNMLAGTIIDNADGYPATKTETKVWSMAYAIGLDMWLASTYQMSIFYSEDVGASWTYAVVNKGSAPTFTVATNTYIRHLYYNEAKFTHYGINELVAIDNKGCIFVSNDGKTWTGTACVTSSRSYGVRFILYAKGRYIISTDDHKLYYSSKDRIITSQTTWTLITTAIYGDGIARTITDINNGWPFYGGHYSEKAGRIIIGTRGSLLYSDDGVTWVWAQTGASDDYTAGKRFMTIGYYNNGWWAFGPGLEEAEKIFYHLSFDNGETWSRHEVTDTLGIDNDFGGSIAHSQMSVTCNVPLDKCSLTRDFWDVDNCCTDFSDSSCIKCEVDYKRNDCCPYRGL